MSVATSELPSLDILHDLNLAKSAYELAYAKLVYLAKMMSHVRTSTGKNTQIGFGKCHREFRHIPRFITKLM